ncbi:MULTISPECIES: hypothetical protein [Acinetobacter]|uniref:hypothetical protein n=1 Tax=Acinetobacter TaxID=469 RepID=UPI0015D44F0C|nr:MULTISPECIES: hypothetical protein [Acinetobacter]WKT73143.1 hypothetical protein Q3F87_15240 [Acinetobacter variabilis]
MKKKSLKQKITCVKWSALAFTIGYFLVGVLLKNDGLKFDPDKTYELIRDALTLTAYFLAPVAAFVLFKDWREEHHIKTTYTLIDEIKQLTQDMEDTLKQYKRKIYYPDRLDTDEFTTAKESLQLLNQLTTLSRLYLDLELNAGNENIKTFKKFINTIVECSQKSRGALEMMDWSSFKRQQIKGEPNGVDRFDGEWSFYTKFFKEQVSIFESNFQSIQELNDQIIILGNQIKNDI